MTKLYAHPRSYGYVGGLCAPRDFKTRTELTSREGFYNHVRHENGETAVYPQLLR